MAVKEDYKYKSLSRQDDVIRLVGLLGIENGQVHCLLQEHTLNSDPCLCPKYTTISYCWGDGARTRSVIVNESGLTVTANVDSMLRQFVRDGLTLEAGHLLWIDAMSINQEDLVEKSHQLPLMRHIFSKATTTLVWLGEPSASDDSDLAMKYAAHFAEHLRLLEAASPSGADISSDLLTLVRSDPHPYGLHSLGRLIERPWFQRVWVIQEIALSTNITVACGSERVNWDDIATCVMTLFHHDLGMLLGFNGRLRSGTGNSGTMQAIRQVLAEKDDGLFLFTLLSVCKGYNATDPRDFVLGMEGMVRRTDLDKLSVGYENSVEQVFQAATEICLSSGHDYQVLIQAGLSGRDSLSDHHFPSWVPDFSSKTCRRYASIGARIPRKKLDYRSGVDRSDDSPIDAPTFKGRLMTVTGAVLRDHIIALSSIGPSFSEEHGTPICDTRDWVEEVFDIAQQLGTRSRVSHQAHTNCSLDDEAERVTNSSATTAPKIAKQSSAPLSKEAYDSLWRTLCADQASDGARAPDEWHENFAAWKKCLLGRSYEDMETRSSFWDSVRHDMSIPDAEKEKALEFADRFSVNTTGCRFCVTFTGRFGLVPHNTEMGDDIAVIVGAEVPFVVRRSTATSEDDDTHWLIVGAAFVHSIIYGEELEAARKQKLTFV